MSNFRNLELFKDNFLAIPKVKILSPMLLNIMAKISNPKGLKILKKSIVRLFKYGQLISHRLFGKNSTVLFMDPISNMI